MRCHARQTKRPYGKASSKAVILRYHNGFLHKSPVLPAKNALTEFDLHDILNVHGDHCHGAIQLTEVEFTT